MCQEFDSLIMMSVDSDFKPPEEVSDVAEEYASEVSSTSEEGEGGEGGDGSAKKKKKEKKKHKKPSKSDVRKQYCWRVLCFINKSIGLLWTAAFTLLVFLCTLTVIWI